MIAVAERGRRLTPQNLEHGTYFAAADEIVTYTELGTMIGRAMGKPSTLNLPLWHPILKLIGGANTVIGNLRGSPLFLNYDKVRDVTAGSWSCGNKKLKQETGFEFPTSLSNRILQTVKWYRNEGWLEGEKTNRSQTSPIGSAGPRGHRGSNGPTMNVN